MEEKTPFEKAGYKPNDVFVVTENDELGYRCEGDIAVLVNDNGRRCLLFETGSFLTLDGTVYIELNYIRKIGKL